jgi:PAS domain-containing protein
MPPLPPADPREAERLFGGMLDNLRLATVMLDRQARITYVNPGLRKMGPAPINQASLCENGASPN